MAVSVSALRTFRVGCVDIPKYSGQNRSRHFHWLRLLYWTVLIYVYLSIIDVYELALLLRGVWSSEYTV